MAEKELAEKLARRLAKVEVSDESNNNKESHPPPPVPIIPQKIVPNPYVAADNSISIDDLILKTLGAKDEKNNNEEREPVTSLPPTPSEKKTEIASPSSKDAPPPPLSLAKLCKVENIPQMDPTAVNRRPLFKVEHHRERVASPSRMLLKKNDSDSELERVLAAQRRKKPENLIFAGERPQSPTVKDTPPPPPPKPQSPVVRFAPVEFPEQPLEKVTPESANLANVTAVISENEIGSTGGNEKSSGGISQAEDSMPVQDVTTTSVQSTSTVEEREPWQKDDVTSISTTDAVPVETTVESKEETSPVPCPPLSHTTSIQTTHNVDVSPECSEHPTSVLTTHSVGIDHQTLEAEDSFEKYEKQFEMEMERSLAELRLKENASEGAVETEEESKEKISTESAPSGSLADQIPQTVDIVQSPNCVAEEREQKQIPDEVNLDDLITGLLDPSTSSVNLEVPNTEKSEVTLTGGPATETPVEKSFQILNSDPPMPPPLPIKVAPVPPPPPPMLISNVDEAPEPPSSPIPPPPPFARTSPKDDGSKPAFSPPPPPPPPPLSEPPKPPRALQNVAFNPAYPNPKMIPVLPIPPPPPSVPDKVGTPVTSPIPPVGQHNDRPTTAENVNSPIPPPPPPVVPQQLSQSPPPCVSPLGLLVSPTLSHTSSSPKSPPPKPPVKSAVDPEKELAEKLERRNKIMEGEQVEAAVNRKLSVYAEFPEFSRKQIKYFNDAFKKFDEDQDNFIDFMELKRMMESLGEAQTHIALKQIIKKVDEDQDGKISLREFFLIFRLAASGELGATSEVFQKLADSIDVTKEGVHSAANFFQAKIEELTKLSAFEEEIKAEQAEKRREEEERKERREKFLQSKKLFQ